MFPPVTPTASSSIFTLLHHALLIVSGPFSKVDSKYHKHLAWTSLQSVCVIYKIFVQRQHQSKNQSFCLICRMPPPHSHQTLDPKAGGTPLSEPTSKHQEDFAPGKATDVPRGKAGLFGTNARVTHYSLLLTKYKSHGKGFEMNRVVDPHIYLEKGMIGWRLDKVPKTSEKKLLRDFFPLRQLFTDVTAHRSCSSTI